MKSDRPIHALFAECGPDLSAFPSAGDFASWLGLCPDNRITGRKGQGSSVLDLNP